MKILCFSDLFFLYKSPSRLHFLQVKNVPFHLEQVYCRWIFCILFGWKYLYFGFILSCQLFSWSTGNIILLCSGFHSFFWDASCHFIDVPFTSFPAPPFPLLSDCCLRLLFPAIVIWHFSVQFICAHPVWGL